MEHKNQKKYDKDRKKLIKKYAAWIGLALLVLILTVMPLLAKSEAEEDGPVASILSGTVQAGSVTTAIHGGGTLSADNAEDVTLPASVKITEFLVKNGQEVTEGTPVAVVDKVSLMSAIVELTDTLDYLRSEIEAARNETVSSSVKATAGGRVKEVYAETGDSVQDVMLEHGALALLSLDGKMAVQLQCDAAVRTGDAVIVTLSDDTQITGRVKSSLDGVLVITVEDEGYPIGEQVTVATEDGETIGTGELAVHNPWKATAFTGTISSVYAKAENTVSSGASLFTLTDTDFTAQMEYLATRHREYEELLKKLCAMYDSGVITAPCDGVISGIDRSSTHLLSAEEAYQVQLLDADKGWSVVLLSNVTDTEICIPGKDCPLSHESDKHEEGCIKACDRTTACDAKLHYDNCIKSCDHADREEGCDATGAHYADCIRSCARALEAGVCDGEKHYLNCIESCVIGDASTACPATGVHHSDCMENCDLTENCPGTKHHHAGCISYCDESEACDAVNHKSACPKYGITYTAYAAKVTAAGNELVVLLDPTTEYTMGAGKSGWTLVEPATLRTDLMLYETTVQPSNKVSCTAGDIILIMTGKNGEGTIVDANKVIVYRKSDTGSSEKPGGMGGMGDLSGLAGMLSGMSGLMPSFAGGYDTGAAATQELFDLEGDVLMTVTPRSTVSLTITVDEQDISKLFIGQMAQVQVEALKGQTFEAEVSEIATTGTNSGGSSKFSVKLEMDMTEDMLDGMSATVNIPLYTKMDVLTIPVAALTEEGAKTVVYTAQDKETGELASPVEVQIGISDGENAEVISGLASGDPYYYSYYDTLELSTAVEPGMVSPFG